MFSSIKKMFAPKGKRGMSEWVHYVLADGTSVPVSEETAIKMSAVYSCVNIIASSLSTLPVNIYERDGDMRRTANNHDQYRLIKYQPAPMYSSQEYRMRMITTRLLWGEAFSIIHREGGRPVKYEYLHPKEVLNVIEIDSELFYTVRRGERKVVYNQGDIIHYKGLIVDGYRAISPIKAISRSLTSIQNSESLMNELYENGSYNRLAIKLPDYLSDDAAYKRLQKSWQKNYAGRAKQGIPILLEGGADVKTIGFPPEDIQLIEGMNLNLRTAARIYNVPPHRLGLLENTNNSNMVESNYQFVIDTLRPEAVMFESEFNRKIFRQKNIGRYTVEVELKGLMRGSIKDRLEWYRGMYGMGVYSPNDIRRIENDNPVEGGDIRVMQMGFIPLDLAKEYGQSIIDGKQKSSNGQSKHYEDFVLNGSSNGRG